MTGIIYVADFRERNAAVAMRWAELADEERKEWARKAESVCSSSVQVGLDSTQSSNFVTLYRIGAPACPTRSPRSLLTTAATESGHTTFNQHCSRNERRGSAR